MAWGLKHQSAEVTGRALLAAAVVLLVAAGAAAPLAAPAAADAATTWLCKPGQPDNPCIGDFTTTVRSPGGGSRIERPVVASRPAIDCFYVYPTVSNQPTMNANKHVDPELRSIAEYQAARFSQHCRVFAPVYRQTTVPTLLARTATPAARMLAFSDVREAWRDYLRSDSRGRGFVLVGHSQGTTMLRALIRAEIDQNPAVRRRLVTALLIGSNHTVRRGQFGGGDFQNVPLCTRAGQTACSVAYSTFGEEPPSDTRFGRVAAPPSPNPFGFPGGPDFEVACTDPQRLAGGGRSYSPLTPTRPFALGFIALVGLQTYGGLPPSAPTPWVIPADRYTGACVHQNGAHVLRLAPTPGSRELHPSPDDTWGTHILDVNLAFPQLLEIVRLQARRYLRAPAASSCLAASGRIAGRRIGRLPLGRRRSRQRRLAAGALRRKGLVDCYCLGDGTSARVGYPSRRLRRALSGRERRRVRSRAVLIATTSPRYGVRGVRAGTSRARLRRAFGRRLRSHRVGRSRFYVLRGRRARVVFRVRGGEVREVGSADLRLTRGTRRARRFLRSFR